MDATRWQRLETLFHTALETDPAERSALLREATADDPTLYDELEAMLAAHVDTGRLAVEAQLLRDEPHGVPDPVGSFAGAYRLIERIAEGGMGVVYRAERADGEYTQTVAVKLVRSGLVTEDLVTRFRSERQILAQLDHPAIARLLDGGITEAGVPYLVMEHVRGQPITEHCNARRLSIEDRLRLFRLVCAAVNHAHQNLIVHRDLKPSNILVTPEGGVKLLDFGIARLIGADDARDGAASTVFQALTPEYASPEQVLGNAITTATDVYALGLLLYELLCGSNAQHSGRSTSLLAVQRAVCEEVPPPPSAAALTGSPSLREQRAEQRGLRTAERLSRRLRGDLDMIVAVALRKEPSRRYASVEQLASDVDRHLGALPVHARGDTLQYRSVRFLQRHRFSVAGAAIIALSIATGLVLAVSGLSRAQRAEQAALEQATTATSALTFMVDLFRASDPADARGDTLTARELLDRGAERIRDELADQPQVRARLLSTIAQAYESLGLFDPAIALVEEELAIHAAHGGATREAGVALGNLADLHGRKGDYVRAREFAREAVAIQTRAAEPYSRELMNALDALGSANGRLGNLAEAREALEHALTIGERTLGPDAPGIASTLNNLAIVHWQEGNAAAATPLFTRAIAILEREYGADHPAVANTMNNLALAYGRAGDTASAIAVHERVLALRERVLGPDHLNVGESLNNLGVLLLGRDFPAARDALERALDIRVRSLPADHPHVATTLSNLGFAHIGLGNPDSAKPLLERALSALDRVGERDRVMATYPMLGLARIAALHGDNGEAEGWYRRVIQIREAQLGPDHPDVSPPVTELVRLLRGSGRHADADSLSARPRAGSQ